MAILAILPLGLGLCVLALAWCNGTDDDAPEFMRGECKPMPTPAPKADF